MSGRLLELLATIDEGAALVFVDEQIGPLLAYDREHGCDLVGQLERALEEIAARAVDPQTAPPRARPRPAGVILALELLDADLERPGDRLALELALKLHRMHAGS